MTQKKLTVLLTTSLIPLVLGAGGTVVEPAMRGAATTAPSRDAQQTTRQLVGEYILARDRLEQRLIDEFTSFKTPSEAAYIARMIGEYRCERAIPLLVKHIAMEDFNGGSVDWYMPCVEALLKMPRTSLRPLLAQMGGPQDHTARDHSVLTLRAIGGDEAAIAWLKGMIDASGNPERRERYQQALAVCERQARDGYGRGLGIGKSPWVPQQAARLEAPGGE